MHFRLMFDSAPPEHGDYVAYFLADFDARPIIRKAEDFRAITQSAEFETARDLIYSLSHSGEVLILTGNYLTENVFDKYSLIVGVEYTAGIAPEIVPIDTDFAESMPVIIKPRRTKKRRR